MKATITINGDPYGAMDLQPRFIHGQLFQPQGHAYFCPDCGELWAQIRVENRPSVVWTIPCKEHQRSIYWPGGTIWQPWDKELMQALPREVLEYESRRAVELLDQTEAA
jgi:hypothetical protein